MQDLIFNFQCGLNLYWSHTSLGERPFYSSPNAIGLLVANGIITSHPLLYGILINGEQGLLEVRYHMTNLQILEHTSLVMLD